MDPLVSAEFPGWLFAGEFYGADDADLRLMSSHERMQHFLKHGVTSDVNPHPLFDLDFYRAQVPGLNRSSALAHYADTGASLGLSPHALFDPAYYQRQAGPSADPLGSYLSDGWRSGFDPHPLFSVDYYLAQAPDVAAAGVEPLSHYVTYGGSELRAHHPLFDAEYYLVQVGRGASEELPLVHYLRTGGVVDPTPYFSSRWYLARSEDARRSPLPPLVHWLTVGASMGIPPSSRALPEVVTDLLLSGNQIGALLVLTYAHSDRRGFPRAQRVLAFGFGDLSQVEANEGLVIGGLPGLVVEERIVIGTIPPERPINVMRGSLAAVVRPDRVLASVTVIGVEEPMNDILVPGLTFDADEIDWLLTVIPSLWEQRAHFSDLMLVLPTPPSPFVFEVIRDFIGWERVSHIEDGELRAFRRGTIARVEPGSLARFRSAMWRDHPHGRRIVLVTHPDDPFDDEGRSLLRRQTMDVGGIAIDIGWGAQALRSGLADAATVYAAVGLPYVALMAAPGCRLVDMGLHRTDAIASVKGSGVAVDQLVLPPIPDPRSQRDSGLLDVSGALAHIEPSAGR